MKIIDLINWFETWANPAWQESWDNCGWQIEPGILPQTANVLVCLTPTLRVMEEALMLRDRGVAINLIFAHHPLLFNPPKSLRCGDYIGEMARLAFTHKIGVYTAHTNFDQVAMVRLMYWRRFWNYKIPRRLSPLNQELVMDGSAIYQSS